MARPRRRLHFIAQHAIAIPHPGWKPSAEAPDKHPPCIVVIAYLDGDGLPWIYDDDIGLRRVPMPEV